jgi:hypothetical protein
MCMFMNPQFNLIQLNPTEIPLNAISFKIIIRRYRKVAVYWG